MTIPTPLVGGFAGEELLVGEVGWVPFFALGLAVALVLVGRALFAGPAERSPLEYCSGRWPAGGWE